MKNYLLKIFFLITILSSVVFSQNQPDGYIFYEETGGEFCSERLKGMFDGFLANLQGTDFPNNKGFVIFTAKDGLEGQILKLQRDFQIYIKSRNFKSERFEIIRSKNENENSVKLLVISKDKSFQKPEIFTEKSFSSVIRFDKGFIDLTNKSRDLETIRYDETIETCDLGINFEDFSKILISNPHLTGVLVIYNSEKNAKKISELAIGNLNKKYRVPKNQLKILYKEKREEPEMELWFIPKGSQLKDSDLDKYRVS